MDLTSYRTLGRSGLIVSPLALGTMTFGAGRWGSGSKASRELFDTYIAAGGNFFDTADVYSGGRSEEMLGEFVAEAGLRDRVVIATKSGFSRSQGTPLHGGNGAKNIRLGIEGSLRRLQTDYIDMYWIHVWDRTTPAEEVLLSLTDAVRSGKILHYGFSNTPAWYVAKLATLAAAHGLPVPIGLQYAYSLVDRGVELDILPAAAELGMDLVPWSPLAAGLLTGKYGRDMLSRAGPAGAIPDTAGDGGEGESDGRLNGDNPFGGLLFTEQNFAVVDVLTEVAAELGRPMAAVALAWLMQRPGVGSVLVGASRAGQLTENIASLEIVLTGDHLHRLDSIGAPPAFNPYFIFDLPKEVIFGGTTVRSWVRPA
ncbi:MULTISPECIES: aldo/keto reductase [unclassified Rhizobium]|uniref:aldo/keto reductase n=1 Tax=unclassified Rhizobium TaxID=2613769 RepID=UPI001ADBAB85|nr:MULTISPECIES: aldo/keto reductase [unclassified Rhizobium]MBO9098962.1 aldo/keto reductase [Rhizobium sp. L58/93]MBO9132233.1 aldo/keto reductase [Rhizobium sp. B209b/85]MBO9169226.1 aldo/keto reductase [Rhizobium sp. L245/93]MBO9185176.1 aldo/keto reductase [Rhizobium sp. E27B/91]QXZ85322.1 aldo/keto reductase [Rhizobium sp. K1/93]